MRFLSEITSGVDPVGERVLVQTMGALARPGCVAVPAFTQVLGRVAASARGRRPHRRGRLALQFDSLEVRPGRWVAIDAVLDTLEYARPGEITDSGVVYGERAGLGKIAREMVPAGVGVATGVGVIPAAIVSGYRLIGRGTPARILSGEIGAFVLRAPLALGAGLCEPLASHADLVELPPIPRFIPHTGTKRSERAGDPINLIFLGSGAELDAAFHRAGWSRPDPPSLRALAHATGAALTGRRAIRAPISTQYFEGRPYDLAYELMGPNFRRRHHLRIWLLDSASSVWVGAADEDVGLTVSPLHARATHRIDPHIDRERDLIATELEATSCADLVTFTTLPGAGVEVRNASGQRMETDGRTAIIRLRRCPAPSSPP